MLESLDDLPGCELNNVSCRFPLYVLPPQSWSRNEAAIFGVYHVWSGPELFGDGLELWLDIRMWDHVLQEVQDLVVGPVVLQVDDNVRLSLPGGWCRSLEKSTHGGPVVIKMMMSGLSCTSGWISKLSISRSRWVMSPCWIGWWWWCSTA